MSNIVERLTENIVARDLSKEGAALVSKWEKTGLLEGLGNDRAKDNMSRLLENQAKELLREASTMAAGDVEGFAAVAFPIVRRVFGGLLANDLVSVQPMSLPSGLIFFLDFTKTNTRVGDVAGDSVYGGGAVGVEITGGVNLSGVNNEKGLYNLNNGYSSPVSGGATGATLRKIVASGAFDGAGEFQLMAVSPVTADAITAAQAREILRYDPDIASGTPVIITSMVATELPQLNKDDLVSIQYGESGTNPLSGAVGKQGALTQARRLTAYLASGSLADRDMIFAVLVGTGTINYQAAASTGVNLKLEEAAAKVPTACIFMSHATADNYATGLGNPGSVAGTANWLLESDVTTVSGNFGDLAAAIPEIDIKVDSVAVTATTKKLRAKWSPELGQDLNAYHNLDAEVELTGILSEQVALEIDREILEDLIKRATAGTLHWSRNPGQFLNRETGAEVGASAAAPDFTGTVSEWYETLIETINDVSARIHRKTLRGGANFVVCSPEVAGILEFTAGFRAAVSVDSNGTAGAVNVGSISKKFDVHVDPYFPRNVVLVGRKGSSFLESGYVYAPYVPLQVTPTIFGTEDFAPRKGVMTRYGKKMVRPDMYGLVVVHGLIGSSGASS
jgi:hypothetical protein